MTGLAGSHLYGPDPGSQVSLPPTSWAPAHLCTEGSAAPCPPSDLPVHEKPRGAHRWELRQPENRAQSPADTFLPAVRWGGKPRGAQQHPSALAQGPGLPHLQRLGSASVTGTGPGTGGPSLAGQPESAPPSGAGQTDHLWLANPSRLPGAAVGPARSPQAPLPLPAPQAEPRAPIPHPEVPSRLRADPAGLGGAWLRVPDTSDRHQGPLVPPHGHPPEFQGRQVPGSWSAATPPLPAPVTPSLTSPPPLGSPTSQGPSLRSNSLRRVRPPGMASAQAPPRPPLGVRPAQSATSFTHQPLPSAPRPPLPESPAPAAAPPAPPPAPGQPGPHTHPRPPRVPAPLGCSPGRAGEAGPRPSSVCRRQAGQARGAFRRGVVRGAVPGRVGRATAEQRSARRSPAPRAPRRGLRAALRAGGRGCGLQPGALSARSAKCTPQAWRPRPPRLLRLRCPPHSLLRRSPSLPSPLRSPPPRLQATPPPSRPAAILTPEWPEVPSPQHTSTRWRGGVGQGPPLKLECLGPVVFLRLQCKAWPKEVGTGPERRRGQLLRSPSYPVAKANRFYASEVNRGLRNSVGGLEFVQRTKAPLIPKDRVEYP